jgi:hypothetical protein
LNKYVTKFVIGRGNNHAQTIGGWKLEDEQNGGSGERSGSGTAAGIKKIS